ncbi:hypothetical protein LK542_18980 [Massilia sp. IC2-477]|uniref:DUF2231 domain-containing protein n=1 Tax=Massilia sp. IC2-477 TaxID=2887198 RepID=UPI001D107AAE|nr:hypothetical protein [Massilia sp. IC2-477]
MQQHPGRLSRSTEPFVAALQVNNAPVHSVRRYDLVNITTTTDYPMHAPANAGPVHGIRPGPFHAILLGGSVPLFLGALLSDYAYYQSHQIQWSNFASWLLAGAELFSGLALLFALINLLRARHKSGPPLTYFLLLLVTWVLGLINSFQHAKDAWAVMPAGLVMSIIVTVLIIITAWIGLKQRSGGPQ